MQSKYLTRFNKLQDKRELFKLHGGRLLVEILPQEEIKSAGGVILSAPKDFARGSTAETSRGTLAIVLLTGEGFIDADGTEYDLTCKPGTVVLLNDLGLRVLSTLPGISGYTANSIAIISEDMVQISWPSLDAFNGYKQVLEN